MEADAAWEAIAFADSAAKFEHPVLVSHQRWLDEVIAKVDAARDFNADPSVDAPLRDALCLLRGDVPEAVFLESIRPMPRTQIDNQAAPVAAPGRARSARDHDPELRGEAWGTPSIERALAAATGAEAE